MPNEDKNNNTKNLSGCSIQKRIESTLLNRDLTEAQISILPSPIEYPNFLGSVSEIKIIGKNRNDERVEYNWILKSATLVDVVRKYANVDKLFKKEIYVYNNIIPAYRALEEENNISEPFAVIPKLQMYFTETYHESLIMDDMKYLGFTCLKSPDPCTFDHVSLAMKTFGRVHALSYALREHKPEEYKKFAEYAKNRFSQRDKVETYSKHQRVCCERVLQVLNASGKDKAVVKTFEKFMENSFEYQLEAIKLGAMGSYALLTHGDAMIENIMFRNGDPERPNIPTEVCLLDWQFCRLGSPAFDISQFIFLTTTKEFRDKYYADMIRTYYYSFCTHLTELKCDAEKILPYDMLLVQLKRFSMYGLCMGVMVLHIIMSENKFNLMNLFRSDMTGNWSADENTDNYRTRIRDIVTDYYEYGYFEFLN